MTVSASGVLSKPLQHMADLLAACAAFQTWVGAADAAAAAGSIHLVGYEDPKQADGQSDDEYRAARAEARPLAAVGFGGEFTAAPDAEPRAYYRHGGALEVRLQHMADVDDEDLAEGQALLTFANAIGAILEEIESTAGTGGHLTVVGYRISEGPARMDPLEVSAGELDVYQVTIEFDWDEV